MTTINRFWSRDGAVHRISLRLRVGDVQLSAGLSDQQYSLLKDLLHLHPGCGGTRGDILEPIPQAEAAGLGNCVWQYDELIQAINAQPNSPHIFDLHTGDHVETNRNHPVNDRVDAFLERVQSTNPPPIFL